MSSSANRGLARIGFTARGTRNTSPGLAVDWAPALGPAVGLDLGRCEVTFHVRRIDLESAVMQSRPVPSSPRRYWPVGLISWSLLFCLNAIGALPWLRVAFPTVDLAAMLYDVGRLQAGYVPYRDTFNHHFVGYVVPFYWLAAIVPLSPVTLKVITLACHFATAVCVFLIVREVGRRDLAWLGAFLTVTTGWFWNWQGFAFNVQSFLEPLWALLLLLVVQAAVRRDRARLFGSALLAGLLVTFDQRALLFLPLIAIPILFVPCMRRAGTVGVAAVGVAIIPVICALYLC